MGTASGSAHKRSASWGSTDHRREVTHHPAPVKPNVLLGGGGVMWSVGCSGAWCPPPWREMITQTHCGKGTGPFEVGELVTSPLERFWPIL